MIEERNAGRGRPVREPAGLCIIICDNKGVTIMGKQEIMEQKILSYINERISEGVPPSIREICAALSIKSTSTVHRYLKSLEDKGLLMRGQNLNRSIRLASSGSERDRTLNVPLIGTVTAGQPILAVEEIEGYVPFRTDRYRSDELFALHVRGESMINAGILDDDIVIARKTPVARNGEIVVALIEDEATVKTFYKEKGHYRLQPENDTMDPIIVDSVAILGKVVSLLRFFE